MSDYARGAEGQESPIPPATPQPMMTEDYSDLAPDEELATRLRRLLTEDHVLQQLQLAPGAEQIEGEPNVIGVNDRNGETLFIEVRLS